MKIKTINYYVVLSSRNQKCTMWLLSYTKQKPPDNASKGFLFSAGFVETSERKI